MEQTAAFNGTTTKDQQAWKTKKGFGPLIVVATLLLGLAFHAGQMSGSRTVAGRTRGGGAAADASLMSSVRSFNTRTDTYYSDDSPMVRVGSPAVQQQENQAFESKTSEHDCDKICCINQVCGPDLWETSCGANFRKTGCGNYVCLQIPTPGGGEDDDLVLNTCTQQGRVCSQNNIISSVSSNGGYLSTPLLNCDINNSHN